jgi:uncharacterized protein
MQQWPYAGWAILVGLALGTSVLLSGNLLVPVIAHIVTNVMASATWKWRSQRQSQVSG